LAGCHRLQGSSALGNARRYDLTPTAGKEIKGDNQMSKLDSVVAVFHTHTEAEQAVKELQRAGTDLKTISIVAKDTHTDEQVVGYYNVGDRMKRWGATGAFWGGFWGWLFGSAFFAIPGIGPILVAGPLVAWIVGALARLWSAAWARWAPGCSVSAFQKTAFLSMKPQ